MSSLSDNGGGASRTFRRGEMSENTPLESQLTDAKMMNTQLEVRNSSSVQKIVSHRPPTLNASVSIYFFVSIMCREPTVT